MRRFLLALLALACAAGAKTFTLEQVLSAPFPSELIASPDGNHVAWMLNERGARNVWVASAPDWKGVRATSYTADDGQDVGQLQWTPDSRSVVDVHGGDLEFLGRPDPNPAMNPAGVEQAIWLVTPGQAPRKIAVGHSPAVSPKGDRIVFLLGGQVWTAPLTEQAAPAMLIHARTGATASELVWSPDGAKVAFVSDRTNHSFIAIYDFTAKSLEYLDPSTDRDRNPVWSPDGRQIAFIRNLTGGSPGRGAHRTGEPWAIRVASVADGAGRQIWKAEPGTGSVFHPMVSEQQLYWGAGNRILFPWEHDGWLHLYSVAVEGGAATLLTPGSFEVEHVTFSRDGKEAVFSSNQDDVDRRHIWRVSIAAGPPTAVTRGEELEWTP